MPIDAKTRYRAKKVKIVFFDIDDTLRAKETGYMPESIRYVFEQLRAKGILTGIATGRAPYGVLPEILDLKPDYLVTHNGSYVLDVKRNLLFDAPIAKDEVAAYVSWARELGMAYGFAGEKEPVVSEDSDFVDGIIAPVYPDYDVAPDFHLTHSVYNMWTFSSENEKLALPQELSTSLRLVPWHPDSSDVVRVDISKAVGVEKVLDKHGFTAANALMFGDGPNDMEIFDYVGMTVAMGNAVPELKEKADFVTKTIEENGILYALEELGLIEEQLTFPQLDLAAYEGPMATIKTTHGDMTIQLFPEQAPKTVANFVALAKDGYYDGIIFHRIIPDFMIQGGDPTGTGMGGQSIYGESFEDEFTKELYNLRGALSMANAGPNTNGSQFFIVQNSNLPYAQKELERGGWPEPIAARYAETGGTPHLDFRHTVFGQLVDEASYAVLDAIAGVETGAQDRPVQDVVIETIEVTD